MGRYITCEINGCIEDVYKYAFGLQSSEMYRIADELNIGVYHEGIEGDTLILERSDIEPLKACVTELRKDSDKWFKDLQYDIENGKQIWYTLMVEAICDFMLKYPDQEKFVFEGEF